MERLLIAIEAGLLDELRIPRCGALLREAKRRGLVALDEGEPWLTPKGRRLWAESCCGVRTDA